MNAANGSHTCMHARLRERTREAHHAAERAMDLGRRLASIQGYIELLQALARVHGAFEQSFARFDWTQLGIDLEERKRMRWLADDLRALAANIARPPSLTLAPENLFEALGALYVLEGSTLGGRIVFEQATALRGISCRHGARFFYGHGQRTGRLWRDFLDALNRFAPARSAEADRVELGAVRAYAEFVAHLSKRASASPA
jgi:heme oxygenase